MRAAAEDQGVCRVMYGLALGAQRLGIGRLWGGWIGVGLLTGGVLSNGASYLIWSGGVPDFIRPGGQFIWNVADFAIGIGLIGRDRRRRRGRDDLLRARAALCASRVNPPVSALGSAEMTMAEHEGGRLRILIANERIDGFGPLAQIVGGLGHEVIAREVDVREVAEVTAQEHPDVALVGLGLSSEHALDLISEIVREASCPVIALLSADNPEYVREAAKRGVFAYIVDTTPQELQSAIDITLQRFSEYQNLQGAFGRRALIEQAKGILMARHSTGADKAFEMLRAHSQHNGKKLADVAAAICDAHQLLMPNMEESEKPPHIAL
jgi:AmiR/NasT family two-component response regulator